MLMLTSKLVVALALALSSSEPEELVLPDTQVAVVAPQIDLLVCYEESVLLPSYEPRVWAPKTLAPVNPGMRQPEYSLRRRPVRGYTRVLGHT